MAKPNYQFKKRQKELAKKKKQEEKRLRKLENKEGESGKTETDAFNEGPSDIGTDRP